MRRPYLAVLAVIAVLTTAAGGATASDDPVAAPFLVGAGVANADPEPPYDGICLAGYGQFCSRPMTEIRDPLDSRAIAITGDGGTGETLVIVTTVAVGLFATHKTGPESRGYGETGAYDIRLRIAERTGLPMRSIIVQSDHSHAAPDTVGLWGGVPASYMERLRDAAADAGVQAYENREPAHLSVAGVMETDEPITPADDEEWRVLVADSPDGDRIATFVNFSSHATVLGSGNRGGASADWPAWASQIAEGRYGGTGIATIGAIGAHTSGTGKAQGLDGGWDRSGTPDERETKARARIHDLFDLTDAALEPVTGSEVAVEMNFIREQAGQPLLLALVAVPEVPGGPVQPGSLSIERSILPPWQTGTVLGTYAGAARVGDVFFPAMPGEVFGEVNTHLKANVDGARYSFFVGTANDFLGYIMGSEESYMDSFESGALWLPGCPDRPLREALGRTTGCSDRWALSPSPTIGMHALCVVEESAGRLGFSVGESDGRCPVFTALDVTPGGAE